MANADTPNHRMHYYNGLLLYEEDFKVEQTYHIDRRQRLNRSLLGYGVADGLEVLKVDDRKLTVTAGTAIDKGGKECIQLANFNIDLQSTGEIYVTIKYSQEPDDYEDPNNPQGPYRRIKEQPIIDAKLGVPPDDEVILASFVTDDQGNIPGPIDGKLEDKRQYVGFEIANNSITTEKIADDNVTEDKLAQDLRNKLVTGGDSHTHTPDQVGALASISGVSNPGGDVGLTSTGTVGIVPDNAGNNISIDVNDGSVSLSKLKTTQLSGSVTVNPGTQLVTIAQTQNHTFLTEKVVLDTDGGLIEWHWRIQRFNANNVLLQLSVTNSSAKTVQITYEMEVINQS